MILGGNGMELVVTDSNLLNVEIQLISSKIHSSVGLAREQSANSYSWWVSLCVLNNRSALFM